MSVFLRVLVLVRMIMSKMIAVIVMLMGRRMNGVSGALGAQVFFRIRAERRDAML